MTDPHEPADLAEMEREAAAMADQIRRLARITRSLSSLTDAIEELRSAAGELAPLGGSQRAEPAASAPPERNHALGENNRPSAQAPPEEATPPAPNGANAPAEPAAPSARPDPVSVTVSCPDGSLDLVRVFRALQPMDGVADLNLLSYAGGRAVLQLVVYKPPQQIQLQDALAAAFPEGITGDWIAPTEYVAVIAGSRRPF